MRNDQRGFLLVSVLLICVAIAILVVGTSVTSMVDRQVSTSQTTSTHAYYVAKAGLGRLETAVLTALHEVHEEGETDACGVAVSEVLDLGDIQLTVGAAPVNVGFRTYDNWLSYDVYENHIYLRSTGGVGPSTQTVQVVADIGPGPAGVWDNAIFTNNVIPGSGKVNGTISVYGSMHIIRGDLEVGENALELSGSAGIYNNYRGSGRNNDQLAVDDEAQNVFADALLRSQDLCTRIKIKSGDLEVGKTNSGAGTRVGADDSDAEEGNPNAIQGIYLGDGEVVSNTEAVGESVTELESNYVFSRSPVGSYGSSYDIGLPKLPAEYPPADAVLVDHSACPEFVNESGDLVLPPADGFEGTCYGRSRVMGLDVPVPAFSWRDGVLEIDALPTGLEGAPDSLPTIAFPDGGMSIDSLVRYDGQASFLFGEGSPHAEGGIVDRGDISITASFVPVAQDYLTESVISLTTNGDVTLDISRSGLTYGNDPAVASIIYAAGETRVEKSLAVFGSLVSGSVTTKAVPSVAHNNLVADVAEQLCLVGSVCDNEANGRNEGILTKMTEENL